MVRFVETLWRARFAQPTLQLQSRRLSNPWGASAKRIAAIANRDSLKMAD
jgi:hypothetical protein